MLEWALTNLVNNSYKQRFIFLFLKEHIENFNVKGNLGNICDKLRIKDYEIISVNELTDGCARTCLLAKDYINTFDELVLANSDQYIHNFNISELIGYSRALNLDASVLTFLNSDSKWSYCRRKEDSIYIDLVKEKEPISSYANTGHFYWKYGSYFVSSAEAMIEKNIKVGGEFYISPSINELILDQKLVSNYHLQGNQKMWGLGVPHDLLNFIYNYGQ